MGIYHCLSGRELQDFIYHSRCSEINEEIMQVENVEPTYENFVTAYYSGDAETFFSFGKLLDDKLINKYFNQLTKEKKILGE